MGRTAVRYGATLIGLYLLVAYATGSGSLISNTTKGAVNVVKAFQGRS